MIDYIDKTPKLKMIQDPTTLRMIKVDPLAAGHA